MADINNIIIRKDETDKRNRGNEIGNLVAAGPPHRQSTPQSRQRALLLHPRPVRPPQILLPSPQMVTHLSLSIP